MKDNDYDRYQEPPETKAQHKAGQEYIPEEAVPCCCECGKEMTEDETNYGTEYLLVCIHCYTEVQLNNVYYHKTHD